MIAARWVGGWVVILSMVVLNMVVLCMVVLCMVALCMVLCLVRKRTRAWTVSGNQALFVL